MRKRKQKARLYSTIRLLRITLAPFWRVSTEHKQHMLFCVSCVTRIRCLRSDQRANNVDNVSAWRSPFTFVTVYVQWILSKMLPGWHGGDWCEHDDFIYWPTKLSGDMQKMKLIISCAIISIKNVIKLKNIFFITSLVNGKAKEMSQEPN